MTDHTVDAILASVKDALLKFDNDPSKQSLDIEMSFTKDDLGLRSDGIKTVSKTAWTVHQSDGQRDIEADIERLLRTGDLDVTDLLNPGGEPPPRL